MIHINKWWRPRGHQPYWHTHMRLSLLARVGKITTNVRPSFSPALSKSMLLWQPPGRGCVKLWLLLCNSGCLNSDQLSFSTMKGSCDKNSVWMNTQQSCDRDQILVQPFRRPKEAHVCAATHLHSGVKERRVVMRSKIFLESFNLNKVN